MSVGLPCLNSALQTKMSRFVSGGTVDEPVEHDEEWAKAQRELEEERKQKADAGEQNSGKSLYEVLQENKG